MNHSFSLGALLLPLLTLSSGLAQGDPPARRAERVVAVFIHDGVELLDFAGPGEVFANARGAGGERFRVVTVSGSTEPVTSQRFLKVVPEYTFDTCPQPAVVVLPGGATRRAMQDRALIDWVKKVAPKAEVMMSVCTGALILGTAGLLDGLQSTTHYGALSALEKAAPATVVRRDLRIVDNGKIVTTAGISAGIDGALHVVERLLGADAARQCAKFMEYRWVRDHYRGSDPQVEPGRATGPGKQSAPDTPNGPDKAARPTWPREPAATRQTRGRRAESRRV